MRKQKYENKSDKWDKNKWKLKHNENWNCNIKERNGMCKKNKNINNQRIELKRKEWNKEIGKDTENVQ